MRLTFEWKATYRDGTSIEERRSDGTSRPITEIDQDRLCLFELVRTKTGKPHIIVEVNPGQKLIHRSRVFLKFGAGIVFDPEVESIKAESDQRIWLIGKHENRRGVNVQQIFVVFEDGHILAMDKWREDFAPLSAPILLPEEEL